MLSVRCSTDRTRSTVKVSVGRYNTPQPSTSLYRHCSCSKWKIVGTSTSQVLKELSTSP